MTLHNIQASQLTRIGRVTPEFWSVHFFVLTHQLYRSPKCIFIWCVLIEKNDMICSETSYRHVQYHTASAQKENFGGGSYLPQIPFFWEGRMPPWGAGETECRGVERDGIREDRKGNNGHSRSWRRMPILSSRPSISLGVTIANDLSVSEHIHSIVF